LEAFKMVKYFPNAHFGLTQSGREWHRPSWWLKQKSPTFVGRKCQWRFEWRRSPIFTKIDANNEAVSAGRDARGRLN
jgi:hypothetical protein